MRKLLLKIVTSICGTDLRSQLIMKLFVMERRGPHNLLICRHLIKRQVFLSRITGTIVHV